MKKAKAVDKIVSHLEQNGLKYTWLCKKIKVSNGHLSNMLNGVRTLTPEVVDKINKVLGTDFIL